ncbi:MAG: 4-hydroxy-3-methylbut-2-enyl diphosphate reductase [Patescibacteria group bacterium]
MKINLAEHAGFCFGVKRALNMVEKHRLKLKPPIKMYGHLVHNEEVVKELTKKNIEVINSLNQITGGTLIITAHGISPVKRRKIEKMKDVEILDTTCPRVSYIHGVVDDLRKENRKVLIFGDREHQEVKGIKGAAGKNSHVFSGPAGLSKLTLHPRNKIGLVAQTTQNKEKFKKIKKELSEKFSNIVVFDTICNTASWRQQETRKMASSHDAMVIIGSSSSANTTRLYQVSKKINPDSYFVSTYKGLKKSWFAGKEKVGVTAGASTPDRVIKDVMGALEKMDIK